MHIAHGTVHLLDCVEVLRTRAILITSPCRSVCVAAEPILAGIAELVGETLEGVIAHPIELHGLCLVLGVSIAALGGPLHHVVWCCCSRRSSRQQRA